MNGGKTPASMPTPSGIKVAKVRTASPGGNVDEHALYVRSEWHKFQQMGAPLQSFAARVVPHPRSVLDVGCGAGQELLPYLDTVAVGIDVRRSGLVEGRSLFGARAPPLLVGAAEALPFARAAFDVVLCRLALPYMNVRIALNEMARVLAPGGALVLQVHHLRYYLRRVLRARALAEIVHALRVIGRGAAFELTGRQMRGEVFQLIGSLRRMLTAAGFAVVEIDESDRGAPIAVARRR
jgi:ubiquinone/menaquinone biosynthesis C-methylase UbiE